MKPNNYQLTLNLRFGLMDVGIFPIWFQKELGFKSPLFFGFAHGEVFDPHNARFTNASHPSKQQLRPT